MTQVEILIDQLKQGLKIDRVNAFREHGIADLRSRISDVERRGMIVDRETVPGKKYLRYFLKQQVL